MWLVEQCRAVPPRETQQARTRSLSGLVARESLDGLRGEGHGGQDRSLGIGVGELAEQLVPQRRVDRDDGQDVGGEGERIDPDTEAARPDLSGIECLGEWSAKGQAP